MSIWKAFTNKVARFRTCSEDEPKLPSASNLRDRLKICGNVLYRVVELNAFKKQFRETRDFICNLKIVSNIFHHIRVSSTLEKFRLVCRSWNKEACLILRQLRTIEFTSLQSLGFYNIVFQLTEETFGTFPHSRYIFTLNKDKNQQNLFDPKRNTYGEKPVLEKEISVFLYQFGRYVVNCYLPVKSNRFEASFLDYVVSQLPNIAVLGLHFQYYHQQMLHVQFGEDTIKNLRNVSSLVIQVDGCETSAEKTHELLSLLFLYLPNLKKISYPGDIRRISKTGLLLRDILLCSTDATAENLTKLGEWNFKTRFLENQCLQLLCRNFPMRSLYMDLYSSNDEKCVSSDIVAGLLRKWSITLTHLEVEFPYREEVSFHFHFPMVMENLTTLYLGGFEGCFLTLLKMLPALKNVELSQLDLISILPKPNETVDVYKNVRQLKLDFCMGQIAGILSRFSRIFPKLQNLNIDHVTDDVARVIFQKMSHLETLCLQGNELTDAGMCGFSEQEDKEKDLMSMSPTAANKFRKYSYIGDLKELHYLELDAYTLTEKTVRHGLIHCHTLRLVKMDCTGGSGRGGDSTVVSRKFKLSEYEDHMLEEVSEQEAGTFVEMQEEPPMDEEALAFFQSHDKYGVDNDYQH